MLSVVTCDLETNAVTRNESYGLDLSRTGFLDVVRGPSATGSAITSANHLLHACVSQ